MIRLVCFIGLSMALTGCNEIRSGLLSQAEKVNLAFPIVEDLITAQNSLFSSLEEGSSKSKLVEQYAALLKIRGLTCSAAASIGLFDTSVIIRKKISDKTCFKDQDEKLAEWVGIQRVVAALQKPALVPLSTLQSRSVIANLPEQAVDVVIARSANVIVLRGNRSKAITVQVPSGKIINSFDVPADAHRQPTVSPNGRVLAVPVSNNALWLMDTEAGVTLWKTTKFSDVTAWLPEVSATVLSSTGNSKPMLLDHFRASTESYPVTVSRLTWSVPMVSTSARYALGNSQDVSIVDHARNADGAIDVSVVKQLTVRGHGISSAGPVLMGNGKKLVFFSASDLGWIDIDTGTQGLWNTSYLGPAVNYGPVKVSETALYLDVHRLGPHALPRLFDIEKETIAAVQGGNPNEGLLLSLAPREGYFRRGFQAVVVGNDVAPEGEAQALEKIVSDAQLAQQLARVNAAAQQMQIATSAGQYPISDRERFLEIMRQRGDPRAAPFPPAAPSPSAPVVKPMLTDVPANAKVSIIGVYEAAVTTSARGGNRIGGVRVNVMPGNTPLVLVLTSYEPVRWTINSGNRKISAILLSGNAESSVGNPGHTQVIKIGSAYAYEMNSAGYLRIKQELARYVSNPVQVFQGGYKGQDFSVN
jgi:hypothetical protein